jgi:hypothetical protein
MNGNAKSALELLDDAATELAQIYRGKHYGFWRADTAPQLRDALAELAPFSTYRNVWIYTGDGVCVSATARFGEWAIDQLVTKKTPAEILAAFEEEVVRNSAAYADLSPLYGVQLDARCELENGVAIIPEPADTFEAMFHRIPFQHAMLPTGTALLSQTYTVMPAFALRQEGERSHGDMSVTDPVSEDRQKVRDRVRLACLLASAGAVEIPLTVLQPDSKALLVAGDGNQASRMFQAHPLVAFPVDSADVAKAYVLLGRFKSLDSLARAIDRLGRSRLAVTPVDRALDLGMAAEITLMHDHRESNTEIAHKLGSRAAWLVGQDVEEREAIFAEMKQLYTARSQAVHSGVLSSSARVDLQSADHLVARVLLAILAQGSFPNWNRLTFGGAAVTTEHPK